MMRKIREVLDKIAAQLLQPLKTPGLVLLGVYTALWGAWVTNPWWGVFGQAMIYSKMDNFMPEWAWGSIAVVFGVALSYGAIKKKYRTLVMSSIAVWWFWSMVSIFYFIGGWEDTGGLSAAAFSIYASFIYLNLRVNKRALGLDLEHTSILIGGADR